MERAQGRADRAQNGRAVLKQAARNSQGPSLAVTGHLLKHDTCLWTGQALNLHLPLIIKVYRARTGVWTQR